MLPPDGIVGDRALEARWWWVQSLTAADDAMAVLLYGWGSSWINGFGLALDTARRAVCTCPPDHPDRADMAATAARIILDLCELAPGTVGPQLGPLLESLREYCTLLKPEDAAPLRVRALPMAMALGGSMAEALIELDSAHQYLADRPMEKEVADSVQLYARFLAGLGDEERSQELFNLVEQGIVRALEVQESITLPATMIEGLEAVRHGDTPKPLDIDAISPSEVGPALITLRQFYPVRTQQLILMFDQASSLLHLGKPTEAISLLTKLIDRPDLESPTIRARILLSRAAAWLDAEDDEAAAADLGSATAGIAEDVLTQVLDPGLLAFVRARVAPACDAEAAFETATRITDGTVLAWRVWAARAAYERARPADALRSYRRMMEEIALERHTSLGYRLDSTSLRNKLPALADALQLASSCGEWQVALELIETFKARQLQAVLSDRRAGIGPPSTLLEEVDRRIDALEYAADNSIDPRAKTSELLRLRSERIALIERSEWQAGAMANTLAPIDQLVEELSGPDLAVVDIHLDLGSRRLTAVGIRNGTGAVGTIDLSQQTVAGIQQRELNLRASSPDSLLYDPGSFPAISIENLLPPDVIQLIDGADSLVISPHGALHLVSWPALKLSGRRLLAAHAVSITPSLWVQAQLPLVPKHPSGIVCFGDPPAELMPPLVRIPGVDTELRIIEDLYRAADRNVTKLTGTAATAAAFRSLARERDSQSLTLHLACHGTTGSDGLVGYRPFLDGPQDPLAACLVLANGVVDADEVRRLRLPFAEVVLSPDPPMIMESGGLVGVS